MVPSKLSLYIHLPVCPARCDYCDFYSEALPTARLNETVNGLVRRVIAEARAWLEDPCVRGSEVTTLYIGGGSPTFLGVRALERLVDGLRKLLPSMPGEWSIESHPRELTKEMVSFLKESPINRLSLGVQSFEYETLKLIGRRHAEEASFRRIRELLAGWSGELSLDFIGERPGQSAEGLREDLTRALKLGATHISVYPLSWPEPRDRKDRARAGGDDPRHQLGYPDFDAWTVAEELLGGAGFRRYEVSNFAQPGHECRHSLAYWRLFPYLGLGPGAVGTLPPAPEERSDEAWTRRLLGISPIAAYLSAGELPAVSVEVQSKRTALFERLMMGLRLTAGVSMDDLRGEFGAPLVEEVLFALRGHLESGLVPEDGRLRCSDEGRKNLDGILRDLTEIID